LPADLLCFSHLRWDFVYQRPNHLMARAAKSRRVFFIEEPIALDATDRGRPRLDRVRR
jgi:UDP-galactopyranose mutase